MYASGSLSARTARVDNHLGRRQDDHTSFPEGVDLPAGGGDPGKALLAIPASVKLGDANTLGRKLGERYSCHLDEGAGNDERMECYLWNLHNWLAEPGDPTIEVLGGSRAGDTAVLDVKLTYSGDYSMLNLVRMVKTEAGWVLDAQTTAGMME